ncbi:hypothetical protein ACFQZ2_11975, partial [Streptomonospora algeriensis]
KRRAQGSAAGTRLGCAHGPGRPPALGDDPDGDPFARLPVVARISEIAAECGLSDTLDDTGRLVGSAALHTRAGASSGAAPPT